MNGDRTLNVEIYGRNYALRADGSSDHLKKIAQIVHDKMVALEQTSGTVDTTRLAILAALNLADELAQLQQTLEHERMTTRKALARLDELVDAGLAGKSSESPA
ncbi:MAG: cell division protein ZapA [Acidobacteria bacterium]|nr:cell division protein ZapA [Acidobacteriota bacterium]